MSPAPADDDREMALFDAALSLPPEDREPFLDDACQDSPQSRRRVREMLAWEQRMTGFLETPFFSFPDDQPFVPGALAAGRFEIRREIAEGGMAVVYEAFDRKLGQPVALKCPKLAFRKRLLGELRNALRVTHPNICRLYEVHSTETSDGHTIEFLTMEYLEGPTLAARLKGSPLTASEVRRLAEQICAGLAEAHAHEVVHGDLKPNNVILASDAGGRTRAVITDFGLAQALSGDGAAAPLGASLRGAAAYIAPERWRGEPASKASDIYALGVLLFEMLTGRRPNRSGPTDWTLLPRAWRKLVRCCLATDPARRPKDASAALACFPRDRSRLVAFAGLVFLTSGVAAGGWHWTQIPVIPDVVRLAVLTADTDPPSSVIGNGVAIDMSERLARTAGAGKPLIVIPVEKSVRYHAGSVEAAQKVLGATHAVSLRWRSRDGGFDVEGGISDARTRRALTTFRRFYQRDGIDDVVRLVAAEASSALRRDVEAGGSPAVRRRYADYAEGMYYLRQAQDAGRARSAFQRVADAVPDDLWTGLRLAQTDLLEYSSTKSQAPLSRAIERMDRLRSRAATSAETALLLASLEEGAGRPERAVEEYSRVTGREQHHGAAWRGLARVLQRTGRTTEAEHAWLKAVEAEPGYFQPRMDLGVLYYIRGQYAAARDQFAYVTTIAPGLAIPHYDLAAVLVDLGDYGRAEQEYHQALAIEEDPDTLTGIGALLAYQHRHAESAYYYERAVASGPEDPLRISNLADACRRTGRSADAAAAYARVIGVSDRMLSKNPADASTRSIRAWALANLGNRREALREIRTALRHGDQLKVRKRAVLVLDALGLRDEAFRLIEDAPPTLFAELNRYPDLSSFVATQRFMSMSHSSARKEQTK